MTNLPVEGHFTVTAAYGETGSYWKNGHKGIDIVSENKKVYSTCTGTVKVIAFDSTGWGRYVSIHDEYGNRHIFCHLVEGSVEVAVGQKVDRTTVIGIMGKTGNVTGVHLHYQINDKNNIPIDPTPYLRIPNRRDTYYSADFAIKEVGGVYKDNDKISLWAMDSVRKVTEAGIMLGDSDGNFRPKDNITREEVAVIVARLLKKEN